MVLRLARAAAVSTGLRVLEQLEQLQQHEVLAQLWHAREPGDEALEPLGGGRPRRELVRVRVRARAS